MNICCLSALNVAREKRVTGSALWGPAPRASSALLEWDRPSHRLSGRIALLPQQCRSEAPAP